MYKFDSLSKMNEFGKELTMELSNIGFYELSKEVLQINSIFHTTSSEYLGMFREILYKVRDQASNRLPKKAFKMQKKL